MELEKELEQFHQDAQQRKAGPRSGSLPFPEALRAFAEHPLETGIAPHVDFGRRVGELLANAGLLQPVTP
ncbi:hypothetical protein P2318_09525 [Myxococcaceae bacterium GXIMD 01537]